MKLSQLISDSLINSSLSLSEDVLSAINNAEKGETNPNGKMALGMILENIKIAEETCVPLCQDTGMFVFFVEIGRDAKCNLALLEKEILDGCKKAVKQNYFRLSVVKEGVFERENTNSNMPPIIYYSLTKGKDITIKYLLKGFGSENTSSVRMINPTEGKEGVKKAVMDIIEKASSKPCPPIFVGVGIGGTMERAAYLSKKALLNKVGQKHKDRRYRALEEEILASINETDIGPAGLGGITALNLSIESEATHIAGLPVAVSINCWADRKGTIVVNGGYDGD